MAIHLLNKSGGVILAVAGEFREYGPDSALDLAVSPSVPAAHFAPVVPLRPLYRPASHSRVSR